MPAFVLLCRDRPGNGERRAKLRPAHLAYLDDHSGAVWLAGPLLSDEGEAQGSLLVIEAENAAAAQRFASRDPYAEGGLFESIEIRPYRLVAGKLLGQGKA